MSDTFDEVLDRMDPEVVLAALRGHLGMNSPESESATRKVVEAFQEAGIDCGPQGCQLGFAKRQLLAYAGNNMIRSLHQRIAHKNQNG